LPAIILQRLLGFCNINIIVEHRYDIVALPEKAMYGKRYLFFVVRTGKHMPGIERFFPVKAKVYGIGKPVPDDKRIIAVSIRHMVKVQEFNLFLLFGQYLQRTPEDLHTKRQVVK
jgi:hypothetical protein